MTAIEMNIEFLRLLEIISKSLTTIEVPDTETILEIINIAQIRYLKEVYFIDGSQQTILEKSDILRDLVRRQLMDCIAISDGSPLNGIAYYATLSSANLNSNNFMFYLRSDSKVDRSDTAYDTSGSYYWFPNEFIKHSQKEDVVTTRIHKPLLINPACYIEHDGTNNLLIIICDSYSAINTTSGVSLEYIKEPRDITLSVNCELPNHMHEAIVKFGVDLYVNEYKYRLSQVKK